MARVSTDTPARGGSCVYLHGAEFSILQCELTKIGFPAVDIPVISISFVVDRRCHGQNGRKVSEEEDDQWIQVVSQIIDRSQYHINDADVMVDTCTGL